jgi:hypothetical protein
VTSAANSYTGAEAANASGLMSVSEPSLSPFGRLIVGNGAHSNQGAHG